MATTDQERSHSDEIREIWKLFRETDRKFEETDRKFEDRKFEETDRMFKLTDRKFEESAEQIKATQKMVNDPHRQMGKICRRAGGAGRHQDVPGTGRQYRADPLRE